MAETLAVEWQVGQDDPRFNEERNLDDDQWQIEITLAENSA